jgi:sulfide:quinone oxidoreductase
MALNKLTDELAVAGQIYSTDIPVLAAEGIRAIICNRPDGEAPDQPSFREIEQAAVLQGIEILYQPIQPGGIGDAEVLAFEKAVSDLPKPVLAYCRTGTRCTALWSLSEAGKRPIEEILERAMTAGYDMSSLASRLQK